MAFTDFALDNRLVKTLTERGFTQPTDIQQLCVPHALTGKDLIASSKTGSGKTLGYLLPTLHQLLRGKALRKSDPRAVILAPTRELAKQVFGELRKLLQGLPLKTTLITGGDNFNDQVKALKRVPHILVATPGRLADHLEHRSVFLQGLEILVLDEADRMLDLGFSAAIQAISRAADHRKRQTLMFSATLEHVALSQISQSLLNNPKRIQVGQTYAAHGQITQRCYLADHLDHKQALLLALLQQTDFDQAMVFTATRDDAQRLAQWLSEEGFSSVGLSGELPQSQRSQIMQSFSRNQQQILVTTDLGSRGLDLHHVSLVINFDLPKVADEYVHRIGRTGRAGREGLALSLIGPKDWQSYQTIVGKLENPPQIHQVEGLEGKFKGLKERTKTSNKPGAQKAKTTANKPKKAKKVINTYAGEDIGDRPIRKSR